MKITARFKAEAASRLFNMKRISPGAGYRFSNCVISTREYLNSTASLIYKTYAASGYMEEDIKNPQTGLMQPYSMAYPIIINSLSETYQAIAPAVFKTYTKQSLSCSSVPSAIYIAISKLKNGNFQEASTTPINLLCSKNGLSILVLPLPLSLELIYCKTSQFLTVMMSWNQQWGCSSKVSLSSLI
jgi:hypothetical protein